MINLAQKLTNAVTVYNQLYDNDAYNVLSTEAASVMGITEDDHAHQLLMVRVQDYALALCGYNPLAIRWDNSMGEHDIFTANESIWLAYIDFFTPFNDYYYQTNYM